MKFVLFAAGVSCIALGTYLANLKKEVEPEDGRKFENISVLVFAIGAALLGIFLRMSFGS